MTGRSSAGKYSCMLVCSLDGQTKLLRKEVKESALEAARALADGLIQDTGLLFGMFPSFLFLHRYMLINHTDKIDVGYQVSHQQGYRMMGEKFKLDDGKLAAKFSGPVDDTETLRQDFRNIGAPRGPAADGYGKRRRTYYGDI